MEGGRVSEEERAGERARGREGRESRKGLEEGGEGEEEGGVGKEGREEVSGGFG